ncbi:MAG TPA: alpha/beta fold hydrolase, partial [Thermoanaerobaculia bacterium]
ETTERVLVGYSKGGRLALQALIDKAPFDRAVIVSAGLNLEQGREERRARDEAWAQRFQTDPWNEVMRDWNAQPVFGGHVVERFERDYDRHELAQQLRENSPGLLPPLAPRLHEIEIPILWIAGERDQAYVENGRRAVSLIPNAQLWICPNAGHRVPWEQPDAFATRLREFVGAR